MNPIPKPTLEKHSAPALCGLSGCKTQGAYLVLTEKGRLSLRLSKTNSLLNCQKLSLVPGFNKPAEIGENNLIPLLPKTKAQKPPAF
jgi:hypothetical protein